MYNEKSNNDELQNLKENLLPGSNKSDAIKEVQRFLNDEGYKDSNGEKLTVDGVYGANTANAVMNYQRKNNLSVDGIVGEETRNSIYGKKKKRKENDSFIESLKTKSGGFFYDRIQNIRKAQRNLGIEPNGKIDDDYITADLPFKLSEDSAKEKSSSKIYDVWKTIYNPSYGNKEKENDDFHERAALKWEKPAQVKPMSEESNNKKVKFSIDEIRKLGFLPEPEAESIFPDYSEGKSPYMEAFEEAEKEYQNEDDGAWQNDHKYEEFSEAFVDNSAIKTEGVIKPGYNAKGKWSEDPDADNYGKDSDTYKMLNDLNSRCETGTKEEKAKYYSVAEDIRRLEKEGTPIKYAQDEIMNLLHENAEIAKAYQNNLKSGYTGIMYNLEGGNYFIDSVAFLISMAYGKWNYKYNDEWRVPYKIFDGNDMKDDNNRNWRPWMYFDGMLISADKLGNMNMAYVGTKMGLPKFVFQNFLTEDKDDAFWVQYGIDLAEQGR